MTRITVDFETQSDVDLKKCGAWEYSKGENTRALCMAFKHERVPVSATNLLKYEIINRPWLEVPSQYRNLWANFIDKPDIVFVAHNAFFEQCIYNNILVARLGWPKIPITKWRCTAAKARACAIPGNLQDAGAVMRTRIQKDPLGHRIVMKLCKPTKEYAAWAKLVEHSGHGPEMFYTPETAPEDFEGLYKYCVQDVLAEELLDKSLPDLIPQEQELWFLDQKINLRGIAVDMPLVEKISAIMASEAKSMNKSLDYLTMGLVSSGNKRAAILDFLTLEGIQMPDLRAKTVDDFLKNGKATGDAKKILEIRRALSKSSTAKYAAFQRRAKSDGRVRDLLIYHTASTGRWGGSGVQPQNFPRGIIKDIYEAIRQIESCELEDLKMLYGENLMPLFSSVLRGMFVASKGHELFVEDFSAIECRVTWWLANHEAGLNMFREGRDPYKEMAAHIYGKGILEITDGQRQVGKAAVLGCGFQMGGKKFVTSAWDVYRAEVTSEIGKLAVTKYRELHWPVTELWENVQNAAIAAVENPEMRYRAGKLLFFVAGRFLCIQLPSGRRLRYCDPFISWDKTVSLEKDGDRIYASNVENLRAALDKGYRRTGEFQSKRLNYWAVNHMARRDQCVIPKWTKEKTYGGKLVENAVQAVARDLLAAALLRAEKAGFKVLMHSHDEAVSEAPKGKFEVEDYRKIMEVLPAWAEGLPVKSSGWKHTRYRKG